MDIKKTVLVKTTKPFYGFAPDSIVKAIISDDNKYYIQVFTIGKLIEIPEDHLSEEL